MIVGAFIAAFAVRFKARRLSYVLFSLAVVQMLTPFTAILFWPMDMAPGLLRLIFLSAFFTAAWAGAGLLFHSAAKE